ncbi:MAG: ABC transporter substrate-binding protein, partial [Rubricoccaceae bacterium]|nr:ABC transporter substrate-binding protein [Rubricoccaceae bacterium]
STLTSFLRLYPNSRYVDEAESIRRQALRGNTDEEEVFKLGIILPATGESGYLAQALFNGVRLAVDRYNNRAPERPVQLVFRDTEGTDVGAQSAMDLVVRERVEAVIGPLFSHEALAAAGTAERDRIVLIAPLATDEEVSGQRSYVFQANPTFAMRGRAMARFVMEQVGLTRLAVVADQSENGNAMAAGFEAEVLRRNGSVIVSERLTGNNAWGRLHEIPALHQLGLAEAVYLPVSGSDAAQNAADALRGLEALGLEGITRVLGNTEWEGLSASRGRASRFQALFTQDYHVDEVAATDFLVRYRELAEIPADRLALIGYDTATFLLQAIAEGPSDLAARLRTAPALRGLAHRIEFDGEQVNQSLFIMAYEDGEPVLIY